MNIDERIEALTQSVELLASLHRDNEGRMGKLIDAMEGLTRSMTSLADVVASHEQRIEDLEEGK